MKEVNGIEIKNENNMLMKSMWYVYIFLIFDRKRQDNKLV